MPVLTTEVVIGSAGDRLGPGMHDASAFPEPKPTSSISGGSRGGARGAGAPPPG